MMKPKLDQTLEEIWAIRRAVAKEVEHDPKKAGAYYRRQQKQAGAKLYKRTKRLAAAP